MVIVGECLSGFSVGVESEATSQDIGGGNGSQCWGQAAMALSSSAMYSSFEAFNCNLHCAAS